MSPIFSGDFLNSFNLNEACYDMYRYVEYIKCAKIVGYVNSFVKNIQALFLLREKYDILIKLICIKTA